MRYDFLMSYNLLKTLHKITPWNSFVFLTNTALSISQLFLLFHKILNFGKTVFRRRIIGKSADNSSFRNFLLRKILTVRQESPAHLRVFRLCLFSFPFQCPRKPQPVVHLDIQRNHRLLPEICL